MAQIFLSAVIETANRVVGTENRPRGRGADWLKGRLDITRDLEVEAVLLQSPLPVITTV